MNGIDFQIEKCNDSQLYVHDYTKTCKVDLCFNCTIVVGPVQKSCQVSICNDSKLVVFCHKLKLRDCHNLEVMLCSPNEVSWLIT